MPRKLFEQSQIKHNLLNVPHFTRLCFMRLLYRELDQRLKISKSICAREQFAVLGA